MKQVNDLATSLSKGCVKLNLSPELTIENKKWKLFGIQSKNREEWAITLIANILNSVVTVSIYDTLGPGAVNYILKQTELQTIFCSGDYVQRYIKMKKDGDIPHVANLVTFDTLKDEEKDSAKQVGISLY